MLAGDPPHTEPTVQSVIAKVVTARPRPLRQLRESVPPHVEAAVLKALAKLPADRAEPVFLTGWTVPGVLLGREAVQTAACRRPSDPGRRRARARVWSDVGDDRHDRVSL